MILEEQFPVQRNTDEGKIGNSIISLLCQLRCHCNPDHNNFSSSSNTIVVAIFPNLCLWRRSLCSNLGGIDPEKLYRTTLNTNKKSVTFELISSLSFSLIFPNGLKVLPVYLFIKLITDK